MIAHGLEASTGESREEEEEEEKKTQEKGVRTVARKCRGKKGTYKGKALRGWGNKTKGNRKKLKKKGRNRKGNSAPTTNYQLPPPQKAKGGPAFQHRKEEEEDQQSFFFCSDGPEAAAKAVRSLTRCTHTPSHSKYRHRPAVSTNNQPSYNGSYGKEGRGGRTCQGLGRPAFRA